MKDSSTDPEWNEQFLFDHLKLEDLCKNRVLELTVWNSTKNSKHYDFIGGLRLGPSPHHKKQLSYMDSSESELSHWMSVINTPGECVEQLHTLRHNMDPLPVTLSSTVSSKSDIAISYDTDNTEEAPLDQVEVTEVTSSQQQQDTSTPPIADSTITDDLAVAPPVSYIVEAPFIFQFY